MKIRFSAEKLGFFRNTDDADVVMGVERPLTPTGRFDDCVESILDRETTLGMDVIERLLALGNKPSFRSDFLLLIDVFAALTLGPEPEEVPGQ